MQSKIKELMEREGLSTSRFAELLGIQPSGVSHIVSGRNKPSFELLQRILRRFPKVNPDWLLLDSEQIYRATEESTPFLEQGSHEPKTGEVVETTQSTPMLDLFVEPTFVGGGESAPTPSPAEVIPSNTGHSASPKVEKYPVPSNREQGVIVERVVIFYSDGTFSAYQPKE